MRSWLNAEVAHVRGLTIRRWHIHGFAVALIALALILIFAVGVFVGYQYPYKTVPAPRVPPGQVKPNPSTCPHVMGGCLPKPKAGAPESSASITATKQGIDLSNNNPVFSGSSWSAIGAHNALAIFKTTEGIGFVDSTAKAMAAAARAHHIVVGGYDFLHICLDSPTGEAHLFVAVLRTDGLTGRGSLPPTGDAEFGGSGCNVRAWLTSWALAVHAVLGRWPMIYTGAWWWNPHVGVWWLAHALAWVSGYTSWSLLPHPSGRSQIDLWQFTDHGWNGATTSDLSVWRDGNAAFARAAGAKPKPRTIGGAEHYERYDNTLRHFGKTAARERSTVETWDRQGCRQPARRPICKATINHLRKLRSRLLALHAKHRWSYGTPTSIGLRNQQLIHRISDPHGRLFKTWAAGL